MQTLMVPTTKTESSKEVRLPAGLPVPQALARGVRRRCPRCGRGRLFERWYTLYERCPVCGLDYERAAGDTWAFMYLTTAALTGLIVGAMLLITPPSAWVGRTIVFPLAMVIIVGSLPYRKGAAIALDYIVELRWNNTTQPPDSEK